MGQQRPFVATNPSEWEVVDDEYEVVDDTRPLTTDRVGSGAWNAVTGIANTVAKASGIPGLFREGPYGAIKDQASLAKEMIVDPVVDQAMKAKRAYDAGRTSEMIGHAASAVPIVGPFVGHIGEEIGAGRSPELIGELATGLAIPAAAKAGGMAVDALPSATRAGTNFQKVMGAAKDVVVDVGPAGDRALRIYELSQKGAHLPKPVANFLQWVTSPKKAPLMYADSRDFASSISRLSANERASMTPVVKREVAQMAADLNLANANAAKSAGMGAEYKSAMREYANAMRMRDAADAMLKHATKAALGAAGLGGGAYVAKRILNEKD